MFIAAVAAGAVMCSHHTSQASPLESYTELHQTLSGMEGLVWTCLGLSKDSEALLFDSLQMKDLADESRQARANLDSEEEPSEKIEKLVGDETDEERAARQEQEDEKRARARAELETIAALSAEQQELLFASFVNTVHIIMYVTDLIPQTIQVGMGIVNFATSLANPIGALEFSKAGFKPKVVKAQLDSRFKGVDLLTKEFDRTSKANKLLLDDIFAKYKLDPPKVEPPKTEETASEL